MNTETYVCRACGVDVIRTRARGQRPKWCIDCRAKSVRGKAKVCAVCSGSFVGSHPEQAHCSNHCYSQTLVKPKPLPKVRPESKPKFCVIFTPACTICDKVFVTRTTTTVCSAECKKIRHRSEQSENRHRRRARLRDAFVAPVYRQLIYKRDGWRCQLCKRKVNRKAVVPHPRAATLDHIIPLAQGGTHEPANVKLACFECNWRKSDGYMPEGEQLALIG